jgi:Popeye protein conserved region
MHKLIELLPYFVHAGAICYLVCFLFRNQIYLRCLAIAGDIFYTAFYYGAAVQPLWDAMAYASLNVLVNIVMIAVLLRDQRQGTFSERDMELFQRLNALSPGEFRRLMKLGTWKVAGAEIQVTTEGVKLTELYYVVEGDARAAKADPNSMQGDGIVKGFHGFIGEVAYLNDIPALTSTILAPGSRYVSWNCAQLKQLLEKDHALKQNLLQLFNTDMAVKIGRFYNKPTQEPRGTVETAD